MNAIILCAGTAERMNGVDKQLLPVNETTLLGRIIDQCKAHGADKPLVITHKPSITEYAVANGADVIIPEARRWTVETFISTTHLWSRRGKRTHVFLGDVYYTPPTFYKLAYMPGSLHVYGNPAEVFAVSFEHNSLVLDRLQATIREAECGTHRGTVRTFWKGLPVKDRYWIAIHDLTMDVDNIADYTHLNWHIKRGNME